MLLLLRKEEVQMCYTGKFSLGFYDCKKRSRTLSANTENENPHGFISPLAVYEK